MFNEIVKSSKSGSVTYLREVGEEIGETYDIPSAPKYPLPIILLLIILITTVLDIFHFEICIISCLIFLSTYLDMQSYFSWRSREQIRKLEEEHSMLVAEVNEAIKIVSEVTHLNNSVGQELLATASVTSTIINLYKGLIAAQAKFLGHAEKVYPNSILQLERILTQVNQGFKLTVLAEPRKLLTSLESIIGDYTSARSQIRVTVNYVRYSVDRYIRFERNKDQFERGELVKLKVEALTLFLKLKDFEELFEQLEPDMVVKSINDIGNFMDGLSGLYSNCLHYVKQILKTKDNNQYKIEGRKLVPRRQIGQAVKQIAPPTESIIEEHSPAIEHYQEEDELFVLEGISKGDTEQPSVTIPDVEGQQLSRLTLNELKTRLEGVAKTPAKYKMFDDETGEIKYSETSFLDSVKDKVILPNPIPASATDSIQEVLNELKLKLTASATCYDDDDDSS